MRTTTPGKSYTHTEVQPVLNQVEPLYEYNFPEVVVRMQLKLVPDVDYLTIVLL
jgi:hypothetical protein